MHLPESKPKDELLRAGIRGKGGQRVHFSRVEPLPGTRLASGCCRNEAKLKETNEAEIIKERQRVVISFGPEHAPLEQRTSILIVYLGDESWQIACFKENPWMIHIDGNHSEEMSSLDVGLWLPKVRPLGEAAHRVGSNNTLLLLQPNGPGHIPEPPI